MDRTASCLIIGSDDIFNIEVNEALAIHVIAQNSLNWNKLQELVVYQFATKSVQNNQI